MRTRFLFPLNPFTRLTKLTLLAGVVGLTTMAMIPSTASQVHRHVQDGKDRFVTCVFVNPGYSGSCSETTQAPTRISAEEACQPILTCLNNPQCAKTYCGATAVRSGWSLESATDSDSSSSSELKK